MSLIDKLLIKISRSGKLTDGRKYLFIGPHPDDIEIGAGETVYKLTKKGKEVKFLICTDGRYGIDDELLSDEEKITVRKKESMASATLLGVKEIEFLPFCDGGDYDVEYLSKEIQKVISAYKPDYVFAPDPYVSSELHTDHVKAGLAAARAFLRSGVPAQMRESGLEFSPVKGIAFYFTSRPDTYVKTTGCGAARLQSILLHKSQFPCKTEEEKAYFKALTFYLNLRATRFGWKSFRFRAEGFRYLNQVQAHCFPESGL